MNLFHFYYRKIRMLKTQYPQRAAKHLVTVEVSVSRLFQVNTQNNSLTGMYRDAVGTMGHSNLHLPQTKSARVVSVFRMLIWKLRRLYRLWSVNQWISIDRYLHISSRRMWKRSMLRARHRSISQKK